MEVTPSTGTEYAARIHAVVRYITLHLAEPLSLQTLARVACFSPFHFHRIFSALVGETPSDFTNRLRIEKAANLLVLHADRAVTEIALDVGYSSPAVFSRAFRRQFGQSATGWRREWSLRAKASPTSLKSKKRKTVRKICKAHADRTEYLGGAGSRSTGPNGRKRDLHVEVKRMPSYHVAYSATLDGYDAESIKGAWDRLARWAGPRGFLGPGSLTLGISFDNPDITPTDKCRYYACLVVPNETPLSRGIGEMEIPGGLHAVLHFEGKTKDIRTAYAAFYGEWLPSSGYQPADAPSYEIYRRLPRNDGSLAMYICMPVVTR